MFTVSVQRLLVEHPIWSMLWFAYDTDDKHDWPRQRSHLLASKPIDGWVRWREPDGRQLSVEVRL